MTKILGWCFALLSVLLAWNLELPEALERAALAIGATPDGWLWRVIVGGGVPLCLVLLASFSLLLYRRAVWPLLPGAEYVGGWWLYALQASRDTRIVGYFRVHHSPSEVQIPEGHAFYAEHSGLCHRGDWSSDSVIARPGVLRFVFSMRASRPRPEALPSQYEGYVSIRPVSYEPVVGVSAWSGGFQDLGDRREFLGPFYAERLSRWHRWSVNRVSKLLEDRAIRLLDSLSA